MIYICFFHVFSRLDSSSLLFFFFNCSIVDLLCCVSFSSYRSPSSALSPWARCKLSSETNSSSFSWEFLQSSKLKGWRWWETCRLQAISVDFSAAQRDGGGCSLQHYNSKQENKHPYCSSVGNGPTEQIVIIQSLESNEQDLICKTNTDRS